MAEKKIPVRYIYFRKVRIQRYGSESGDELLFKDGNVAQELHQTRAVLVLRYLFERQLANFDFFSGNFKRPFTPRTKLGSA